MDEDGDGEIDFEEFFTSRPGAPAPSHIHVAPHEMTDLPNARAQERCRTDLSRNYKNAKSCRARGRYSVLLHIWLTRRCKLRAQVVARVPRRQRRHQAEAHGQLAEEHVLTQTAPGHGQHGERQRGRAVTH